MDVISTSESAQQKIDGAGMGLEFKHNYLLSINNFIFLGTFGRVWLSKSGVTGLEDSTNDKSCGFPT